MWKVQFPQNEWTDIGDLTKATAIAAIVNHCGNVIISGGLTDYTWEEKTNTFQIINIESSKYGVNVIQNVSLTTWGSQGVIVDHMHKMYIFGGVNDVNVLDSIVVCNLDNTICSKKDENNDIILIIIGISIGTVGIVCGIAFIWYRCIRKGRNNDTENNNERTELMMSTVVNK